MLRRSISRGLTRSEVALLAISCAIAGVICASSAFATSVTRVKGILGPPPLLIIGMPQLSWTELRAVDMPNTHALLEHASVGLMPIASPSDADPNRTWVTLGAGRAAAGGEITGDALPGGGFQVDVGPIRAANERAHSGAVPGLLGSRLHERGYTTALIAYRASKQPQAPPSATAIMDEDGRIDGGGLYDPSESAPFGKRLPPSQVRSTVNDELSRHDVVLLDLTGVASPENVDAVIGEVAAIIQHHRGRLCLITALGPAYREKERRAMGVLVARNFQWDRGVGLLTSRSTRWRGVVTASDFAPTLLGELELPAASVSGVIGRPMEVVPTGDPLKQLDRLDQMLTDQFTLEGTAARLYASYMMLLAAATFAVGLLRRSGLRWLAMPALIGVVLPIGLLVAPLAGAGQARQVAAACMAAVALGMLALWPGRASRPLMIALLVGAGVTIADPLLGSPLMRLAPLGFGVVTGSRFYGIANEYAGVLGAMAAIGLGLILRESQRSGWAVALAGAMIVLVTGAPWWGANWGGSVSVAAGLISVWVLLAPGNRRWRVVVGIIGVLIAAALPAALDLLRPAAERSHIGVAAAALLGGHFDAVRDTAARKLAMNWRLIQLASWWWLLAPVGLLGIWELIRRGKEMWRGAQLPPAIRAGFLGALVAAFTGMVVNDSGIVMLGMALAVTFGAFVFLVARKEAAAR